MGHERVREGDELRLTIKQYRALPRAELERIAKKYGKTSDAFLAMLSQGERRGAEVNGAKHAKRMEDLNFSIKHSHIEQHEHYLVKQMQGYLPRLGEARALERTADDLFGRPGQDKKVRQMYLDAERTLIYGRFGELCDAQTLGSAYYSVKQEKEDELRRTNNPLLGEAVQKILADLAREIDALNKKDFLTSGHSAHDSTGSAERFDTVRVSRWPGNGRSPHRLNDEHEGW